MYPGSGDATVWPIEQQRELFSLLRDIPTRIWRRTHGHFQCHGSVPCTTNETEQSQDVETAAAARRREFVGFAVEPDQDRWAQGQAPTAGNETSIQITKVAAVRMTKPPIVAPIVAGGPSVGHSSHGRLDGSWPEASERISASPSARRYSRRSFIRPLK